MAGRNQLDYTPLNNGALAQTNRQVEEWVQSWWKDASGDAWYGHKLKVLETNDWTDLPNNESPILWVPPSC